MGKKRIGQVEVPKATSLRAWLNEPRKYVTRGELWSVLNWLEKKREERKWWRRLWHHLTGAQTPEEDAKQVPMEKVMEGK